MPSAPDLVRRLKRLRLGDLLPTLPDRATQARQANLSHLEFLELLLPDEIDRRDSHGLAVRLAAAGFEETASLEQVTWDTAGRGDRARVRERFTLPWCPAPAPGSGGGGMNPTRREARAIAAPPCAHTAQVATCSGGQKGPQALEAPAAPRRSGGLLPEVGRGVRSDRIRSPVARDDRVRERERHPGSTQPQGRHSEGNAGPCGGSFAEADAAARPAAPSHRGPEARARGDRPRPRHPLPARSCRVPARFVYPYRKEESHAHRP